MKKWIIRLLIVCAVVIVAAVVVVFLQLNTIVKKAVETVGPQLTKVEIKLAGANISPLSGSGQLSGLFVGNPEGYKTPSAIKVGDVKVVVAVSSLLSDTIRIKEIKIQAPEITFEGGFGGNNISKILENVKAATGGDQATAKTAPASQKPGKKFYVQDITVEGARLNASITGFGGKELTLPLPPLHLQNVGTENMGVTAGELVKQILEPLLASVTKAVAEGAGKGAGESVNKVTSGLKGLFKK